MTTEARSVYTTIRSRGLKLFDAHIHAGEVNRSDEIAEYAARQELLGAVLLSLPLADADSIRAAKKTMFGSAQSAKNPGSAGSESLNPPNYNAQTLETKKRLQDAGLPNTKALGSLDNRPRLEASAAGHESESRRNSTTRTGTDRRGTTGPAAHTDTWNPAAQIAALDEAGFDGVKLWEGKPELAAALGVLPDDEALIEACREAGRRGMPVLFHVADPPEFWSPEATALSLAGKAVPDFTALIDAAGRLCRSVPETTFIFPHLLFLAGDLEKGALFLDEAPHAYFDLAPGNYAYGPLAANPAETRAFFSAYRDRILLGSDAFFFPEDGGPLPGDSLEGNLGRLERLVSFLAGETSMRIDNPYPLASAEDKRLPCLDLPDEVLEPIFAGNALNIFGGGYDK